MENTLSTITLGFDLTGRCGLIPSAREAGLGIAFEMSRAEMVAAGRSLNFVVENRLAANIEAAIHGSEPLNIDGLVVRPTLFDIGNVPAGRPRVRWVVVPDMACTCCGQVLINAAKRCEGEDLGETTCTEVVEMTSRIAVEVTG